MPFLVVNPSRTDNHIKKAIATISKAVQGAVDNCKFTARLQMQDIKLAAAWVGMAGYGRPLLSPKFDNSLSELLGLPLDTKLIPLRQALY